MEGSMHTVGAVMVAVAVLAACGLVAMLPRRRAVVEQDAAPERPSMVRVLNSDAELRDAARRAARFETLAAAALEARARRYEALADDGATLLHVPRRDLGREG